MARLTFLSPKPARLVAQAYGRFFRQIPIDEAWGRTVRTAAARGGIVYVLRSASLVDLLALEHLTRDHDLPRIGFANELSSWVDPSLGRSRPPPERLCEAMRAGDSAVLFLKRAPGVLDRGGGTHRGRSEGDDLLKALIDMVRREPREIMLIPQMFVWTQRSERRSFSLFDTIFGPVDFPGNLRALLQFLLNHKNCVVR